MSELEQLRQEAEQLRNQIRVRQRFACTCLFMLTYVCVVHVFVHCMCATVCSLQAVTHTVSDETVTHSAYNLSISHFHPCPETGLWELIYKCQLLLCDYSVPTDIFNFHDGQ